MRAPFVLSGGPARRLGPRGARGQQQIRPEPAPLDPMQVYDFIQTLDAIAGHRFPRIASAEDFRRVEKRHAMRETADQERCVHFTAAFNKEADDIFRAQFF